MRLALIIWPMLLLAGCQQAFHQTKPFEISMPIGVPHIQYGMVRLTNPQWDTRGGWFHWQVDAQLVGNFQRQYFVENHLVGKVLIVVRDEKMTELFSESEVFDLIPGKIQTVEQRHDMPKDVVDRIWGFEASPQVCHLDGLKPDEQLDLKVQAEVLREGGK